MRIHLVILVDVLVLGSVTLVLSAIALALLQPSDEAYIPALVALSISLALIFSALIGISRSFKVEKKGVVT